MPDETGGLDMSAERPVQTGIGIIIEQSKKELSDNGQTQVELEINQAGKLVEEAIGAKNSFYSSANIKDGLLQVKAAGEIPRVGGVDLQLSATTKDGRLVVGKFKVEGTGLPSKVALGAARKIGIIPDPNKPSFQDNVNNLVRNELCKQLEIPEEERGFYETRFNIDENTNSLQIGVRDRRRLPVTEATPDNQRSGPEPPEVEFEPTGVPVQKGPESVIPASNEEVRVSEQPDQTKGEGVSNYGSGIDLKRPEDEAERGTGPKAENTPIDKDKDTVDKSISDYSDYKSQTKKLHDAIIAHDDDGLKESKLALRQVVERILGSRPFDDNAKHDLQQQVVELGGQWIQDIGNHAKKWIQVLASGSDEEKIIYDLAKYYALSNSPTAERLIKKISGEVFDAVGILNQDQDLELSQDGEAPGTTEIFGEVASDVAQRDEDLVRKGAEALENLQTPGWLRENAESVGADLRIAWAQLKGRFPNLENMRVEDIKKALQTDLVTTLRTAVNRVFGKTEWDQPNPLTPEFGYRIVEQPQPETEEDREEVFVEGKEKDPEKVLKRFRSLQNKLKNTKNDSEFQKASERIQEFVRSEVFIPLEDENSNDYERRFKNSITQDLATALKQRRDDYAKTESVYISKGNSEVSAGGKLVYAEILKELIDYRHDLRDSVRIPGSDEINNKIAAFEKQMIAYGIPEYFKPKKIVEHASLLSEGVDQPARHYIEIIQRVEYSEAVGDLSEVEKTELEKAKRAIANYEQSMIHLGDERYEKYTAEKTKIDNLVRSPVVEVVIDRKPTGLTRLGTKTPTELRSDTIAFLTTVQLSEVRYNPNIHWGSEGVVTFLAEQHGKAIWEKISKLRPMDENVVELFKRLNGREPNMSGLLGTTYTYQQAKEDYNRTSAIPESQRSYDDRELLQKATDAIEIYKEDLERSGLGVGEHVEQVRKLAEEEIRRWEVIKQLRPLWQHHHDLETRRDRNLAPVMNQELEMASLKSQMDRIREEANLEKSITYKELQRNEYAIKKDLKEAIGWYESVRDNGKNLVESSEKGVEDLPFYGLRDDIWMMSLNGILNELNEQKDNLEVETKQNELNKNPNKRDTRPEAHANIMRNLFQ